jgi:hypothetical protein
VRKRLPLALVVGLALMVSVIVLVGTYTFLPLLAERMVARNVQEGMGLRERPEIELQSDPAPAILAGMFSGGRISLGDADLGDVRVRRVVVNLDPFDLDMTEIVMTGAIRSDEPLSGTLRAEVSEGEISRFTKAQDIELKEGRVLVISEAQVLGFDVPVSIQGSLVLRDGALIFEPRRMWTHGTPLPGELREQLLTRGDFSYPLRGLPHEAEITGVEVSENRLILSGEWNGFL